MARKITIASGKGGVGKTTSAINIAHAMNKRNNKTLLIDGNLSTPNVHIYLGWPILKRTLVSVMKHESDLKDAIYKHSSGLRILPSISSAGEMRTLKVDRLAEVMDELEGEADVILLDSAAGIGRETLGAMQVSDEVLIVTNPEMAAVLDAQKTVQLAHELGKTILGVVLNKVKYGKHEMKMEEVEKLLDIPVIGVIPFDENISKVSSGKHPVTHAYPRAKSSKGFDRVAEALLGRKYLEGVKRRKSLKDYVLKMIGLGK
ncbi:cell division ATPase MinD [Candidatus Woesearchaeota archaeon]|nr:cell division ATPase MinD [Candidatus Woesearchaeota archaeon]